MNRLLPAPVSVRIKHIRLALFGVAISWSLAVLMACTTPSANGDYSLYQQLGGQSGVTTVVNRTMDRVSTDPRSKRSFQGVKMPYLKESVVAYICKVADGPCQYEGETMANSHAKSNITASEFDLMVTILREELDRAGISDSAKNELLRRVSPTRRDIVKAP